ncbi:sensor histidine kinase YxjM [Dictyobacter alpinus]|uniref:histidine kinase n=1 Tax=Dictyobacter alpinus TaxID=2014873 RepID=A0A402BBX2_9CHLR|nr:histidine kinase [Dictyobacter alpinus]GCE28816.1 sensor histidine kinase YxjM [Dictyobacter alpinus]
MSWQIRSMTSILTLAIAILYEIFLKQTFLEWCVLCASLLLSLFMIWIHQSWWSRTRYIVATGLLIAFMLIHSFFNAWSPYSSLLLLPLVLVLARDVHRYPRLTTILAVVTIAAMLVISSTSNLTFTLMPWLISAFMGVRAINAYKYAYSISQLHLLELNQAHCALQDTHDTLQEATIHSIRYAAMAERTRLAREMHDGLGHQLTSLIVQLQALKLMLPMQAQQAADAVPAMLEVARTAMADVRQAVHAWDEDESASALVSLQGLVSQTAAHAPLSLDFRQDDAISDWPIEIRVTLYRILQELLTNIMRHAEATSATIQVQEQEQQVILTVADNGSYTADRQLTPGFGLKGIMQRSQKLGGSCTFSPCQPHGLQVQVILPATPTVQHAQALHQGEDSHG